MKSKLLVAVGAVVVMSIAVYGVLLNSVPNAAKYNDDYYGEEGEIDIPPLSSIRALNGYYVGDIRLNSFMDVNTRKHGNPTFFVPDEGTKEEEEVVIEFVEKEPGDPEEPEDEIEIPLEPAPDEDYIEIPQEEEYTVPEDDISGIYDDTSGEEVLEEW